MKEVYEGALRVGPRREIWCGCVKGGTRGREWTLVREGSREAGGVIHVEDAGKRIGGSKDPCGLATSFPGGRARET